jgi:hypothetical protein
VYLSLGRVQHTVGQMRHCRMLFHSLPTFAIMEFHPIVITVLSFSCIPESLGEKFLEVVVIWGILESKIANIA